jgi:hypothetical protein
MPTRKPRKVIKMPTSDNNEVEAQPSRVVNCCCCGQHGERSDFYHDKVNDHFACVDLDACLSRQAAMKPPERIFVTKAEASWRSSTMGLEETVEYVRADTLPARPDVEAAAREWFMSPIGRTLSCEISLEEAERQLAAIISKHCAPSGAGEFTHRVLRLVSKYDIYDSLFWNSKPQFFMNVNDDFWWGTADLEEITTANIDALEQAITDCEKVSDVGSVYAPMLFAARIRGIRPQGASYPPERELWPLLDACGPEREVEFGNPYKPGDYKPTSAPTIQPAAEGNHTDCVNSKTATYYNNGTTFEKGK